LVKKYISDLERVMLGGKMEKIWEADEYAEFFSDVKHWKCKVFVVKLVKRT
jgi:hypothetical protein